MTRRWSDRKEKLHAILSASFRNGKNGDVRSASKQGTLQRWNINKTHNFLRFIVKSFCKSRSDLYIPTGLLIHFYKKKCNFTCNSFCSLLDNTNWPIAVRDCTLSSKIFSVPLKIDLNCSLLQYLEHSLSFFLYSWYLLINSSKSRRIFCTAICQMLLRW